MHVRQADSPCRFILKGETYVGDKTAADTKIRARALDGELALAIRGYVRYYFGTGVHSDVRWHFETVGTRGVLEASIAPPPTTFPGQLVKPTRAEMRVTGAAFASGSSCGEEAEISKQAWETMLSQARTDVIEAMRLADTLDETSFARAVTGNLIKTGPYARASTPLMNATFRARLIAGPHQLVKDYKQVLRALLEALKPSQQTKAIPAPSARSAGF